MVRQLAGLVLLASLLQGSCWAVGPIGGAAGTSLYVELNRHTIELGQPVQMTLRYQGDQRLAEISLDAWDEVAAIYSVDEYTEANQVQVHQLRLYPRQTGTVLLPALGLGAASSTPATIKVNPARVDGHEVDIQWSLSTQQPWQRQAIKIDFKLTSGDYAAHVAIDPLERHGIVSQRFSVNRHQQDGRFEHGGGWLLYPLQPGRTTISLPPVRYRLSGSDIRQFHLPLIPVDVKQLPPYLLPTLPVGRVDTSNALLTDDNGQPYWQVRLTSDAPLPDGIAGLDVILAQHSQRPLSDISLETVRPAHADDPLTRLTYRVPLPQWLLPYGPALQYELRYFEPQSGRLVRQLFSLPRILHMPAWAWGIVYMLLALAVSYCLYLLWPQLARWRTSHQLRSEVQQLEDAMEIRQALLRSGNHLTLAHWAGSNTRRQELAEELNRAGFGPCTADIDTLRSETLRVLSTS